MKNDLPLKIYDEDGLVFEGRVNSPEIEWEKDKAVFTLNGQRCSLISITFSGTELMYDVKKIENKDNYWCL